MGSPVMPNEEKLDTRVPKVTEAECEANRVPLQWRDQCAHLLIPLNKCRWKNSFKPWECVDLRHAYEACQYEEFKFRVAQGEKERQARAAKAFDDKHGQSA